MEEMLFKDISYLELWQPFGSVEQNHLCNFGRGCNIWASGSGEYCRLKDSWSGGLASLLFG